MWSRSRLSPKDGDQKYHLDTTTNKKDHVHLKVGPNSRVGQQHTALNFRKRDEQQLENGNLRNLVPNPNSSKPVTSKQVKIHDEPNIVAEALRDFGNELRNFILVNDKLKKRKPSFDSLLRRLGHLNQLTGFEVDSDVLATIKSVKTKYKKHPSESKKKRKRIICMFDSRTLDKIIGESNQLENKETKISNVHISKMPKEHYQIVVKNKKESDQNERQKEKRKVNLDEDQSIEKKNKWEIKQDRGNKEVFTVMSAANAKKPKEKEIRVREEKVYTMLQSVCRTKDLENRKREEKNKKQLSGNIREAMDGSKSCLAIKNAQKPKARERERTKGVSLERRASRSCNGHVETCEYRLKRAEDKKLVVRKKKVSWEKLVDQNTTKTKAKRKEAKRVLEKSDKELQVVSGEAGPSTAKEVGTTYSNQLKMRSSVGDRISRESVDTKMFKRESLSLVQECSEPFASSTIQDSCKKQSHDKVGYGFDARKEVDVLQLYRMKESTSSTTSNGTQYQLQFPNLNSQSPTNKMDQLLLDKVPQRDIDGKQSDLLPLAHMMVPQNFLPEKLPFPRPSNFLKPRLFSQTQQHSPEVRGSFSEPPKSLKNAEKMRKLDAVVLPVYDSKLDSSHSKVSPIRTNLTVNTFQITVEPYNPQQPLNMVSLPIWESSPVSENLQKDDQPVVEKASSWILKLPKDSPRNTENKTQPSCIFKKECIENTGYANKLKLRTYIQGDLIKTEKSKIKQQCYTFKQDEREGNVLNPKVENKNIDKSVQVPSASGDRSSSLEQDSDECILKLYVCKKGKTKKSELTKSGGSDEYLNKVYTQAAETKDLIRNFQVIEKIRKGLTENSESGDSSVEVCCEELNKKRERRNNLRRSSQMKMVVRKPSVRVSSCALKEIRSKKLALKPSENLQSTSYSILEKSEDKYPENKSIQPSSSGCSAERGKVFNEEFRSSCNLFVETPQLKSDLGRSNKGENSLISKIPRPRQDFANSQSKKRFRSLQKKSKISNKPPSISSSETSNVLTPNFWKPINKKQNIVACQQTGSKIPKKLFNLPTKTFSKPITNNEKIKVPKIALKKSSNSSLLKKKLSMTTSSSEKPRRVVEEHQSFQEAEKKQTNGSSNRPKFKRNVSMLPIPRNRINGSKKKLEEQTKSNDPKDRTTLKSETTKSNEKEEKSALKKSLQVNNNEKESRNRDVCEAQQPASVQDQLVTKRREQNKGKFDLHALMTMGGLDEALEVAKRILEQQSCLDKEANITTPCNKPLEDPPGHSRLRRAAASKVAKSRIPVPKKQKNPPKLATTNPSIESYENDVESTNLDNTCPDCLYCKLPAAKVQPSNASNHNQESIYTIFDAKSKYNSSSSSGTNSTEIYNKLTTFNLLWHDQNTTTTPPVEPDEEVVLLQKAIGELKKKPKKIGQRKICLLHSCQILKRSSSSSQSECSEGDSAFVARQDRIIAISQEQGDFFGYYHHLCSTFCKQTTAKNKPPQLRHSSSLSGVLSLTFPFKIWSKANMELCGSLEQLEESGYESYRTPGQDGFSLPLVLNPLCSDLNLVSYRVSIRDWCKPHSKWYYMGKRDGHRNFGSRELPQTDSKGTVCIKYAHKDTSVQTNGPTAVEGTQKKKPALIKSLSHLRICKKGKSKEEEQRNMAVSNRATHVLMVVEERDVESTKPKRNEMENVTERRGETRMKHEEEIKVVELTNNKVPDKLKNEVVEQRRGKMSSALILEPVNENKKNREEVEEQNEKALEEQNEKALEEQNEKALEEQNEKAVEVKLLKQNTSDTGTETEVSLQRSGSSSVSKYAEASEHEWKEIKAPPTSPILPSEENVFFKDRTDIPLAEPEESIAASKLYLARMGQTEINIFAKQNFDSASITSITSMDQPKPGTSKTSTSSTRLRKMLKSPIESLISLAKRRARKKSEMKLQFIKENEDKEQETQTTDYAIRSDVKEKETKQDDAIRSDVKEEETKQDDAIRSDVKDEETKQDDAKVSLPNHVRLAVEVESITDLDESVMNPTVDPKTAEESKPKPIRKLETIEESLEGAPSIKPSSKTVHLNLKELDKVQSLDKIEAYIKKKIDENISSPSIKPSSPKSSKADRSTPPTSDEEMEAKSGFRSCNCSAARQTMTDKELFEKLLRIFEKQEGIVEKLSQDENFIRSQLSRVKSRKSLEEMMKNICKNHKCQHAMTSEEILRGLGTQTESPKHEDEESGAEESPTKFRKFTEFFKRRKSSIKEIYGAHEESKRFYSEDGGLVGNEDEEQRMKIKFFEDHSGLLDRDLKKVAATMSDVSNVDRILVKETGVADFDPTLIGKCFQRGFRSDHISLSGDTCLLIDSDHERKRSKGESVYINFSERESPMDFLLALGFSIDEASNALKDDDVRNRLLAAIIEAKVWINQISPMQGTLLYLVAYKAKPKIMRYFLQLVEAVINERITDAVKLDTFIRMLEKVEDGDLTAINILGAERFGDEQNEERLVKKQLRQLFLDVYQVAESEAEKVRMALSKEAVSLLRMLAAKYRAGLHPHLELIAQYIGQGLLNTEVQLEAAMIYLSRLETAEVNLPEFEQYCAIRCPLKGRVVTDEAEDSLWK